MASLCVHICLTPCWPGYRPCALKHPTLLCRCISVFLSPNWVTVFLKSTLGKFTCLLVFVLAWHLWLHHGACSELLNWSPISHQDMKGPYGRPRNHLLQWLHNTLAHCRLSCFLIQVSCWLHLPIVLFSSEVRGSRDWGVGRATLTDPWLKTGDYLCTPVASP